MLPPTDADDAATLLREARLDAGLTQRELAARSGMRQSHIAAIESGTRHISADLLARLLGAADYRPSIALERRADEVRALAAEHGLGNVRVFGSIARGEDGFRSDVDLLVDISRTDVPFGLANFVDLAQNALGFPVDVVVDRPGGFADTVRADAVPL